VRWARVPDRLHAYIALAVGLLALSSLLGEIGEHTGYRYRLLFVVSLVAFVASGYFLLLVRHELLPLSLWARGTILGITVVTGVAALLADLPYTATPRYTPSQSVVLLALVAVWTTCVGEPIVRFWLASRTRPAVQRARLRSLSFAYAGIVAILVIAVAVQPTPHSPLAITIGVSVLALLPLLYAALAPPRWLRRAWRQPEEEDFRLAQDLLSFEEDPAVLGERALNWALRLVGGSGGFIFDGDGALLAVSGFDEADVRPLARALTGWEKRRRAPVRVADRQWAVGVAVPTEAGPGLLCVMGGALTPLFGSDEVDRLRELARSVGVALDRVRLAADLARLDRARRDFIANAAHELRTPLTTIVGLSSTLVAGKERVASERLFAGLDAVDRQAQRMRSLVNNLLDLSQVEQGRLKVDLRPLDMSAAVDQALEGSPPDNGATVQVDIEDGLRVVADPMRLDQVLTNLLTNAYRYGGKEVRVAARAVDGEALVVVSDDGPGVPPELASRVFEPFARGQNGSDTRGSGLGLAIVLKLVEAFGGTVSYEPAQPTGARFLLRLRRPA
jgi:signal transduction histidine kinase